MSVRLFFEAIVKFLLGIVLVGALLFLPAGTFNYNNAWLFMILLFLPMFIAGIVMMVKNPFLLRSRLEAKEKQKDQDKVVKLSGLMFLLGFIISGLGVRFSWYTLPRYVVIIGSCLFIFSYILYGFVLKQNTYLSRTIKVTEGQRLLTPDFTK